MEISNEVLVGTDGWFEYGLDAPSEVMEVAIGGWVNFADTDTTTGIVPSGYLTQGDNFVVVVNK